MIIYFQTYSWKGNEKHHSFSSRLGKQCVALGITTTLFTKSGSTIVAIDGPAHGLSKRKEFNIPPIRRDYSYRCRKIPTAIPNRSLLVEKPVLYYQSI